MLLLDILYAQFATVEVTLKAVPTIEVKDSGWAVFAALMGALTGIGTFALAVATFRLAKSTAQSLNYETVREQRAARPILIAKIESKQVAGNPSRPAKISNVITLSNKGAAALYIFAYWEPPAIAGIGKTKLIQVISGGEDFYIDLGTFPGRSSLTNVRLRYSDIFDNVYITEYRSLGSNNTEAIFRLPRLAGEEKPRYWSGSVSWPISQGEASSMVDGKFVKAAEELDSQSHEQ